MCSYHYSISVRLDSNINLLVKLGSVVRLKPDLLTPGIMRAKPANFACDFRIHISRVSEKKSDQFQTVQKMFRRIPNVT